MFNHEKLLYEKKGVMNVKKILDEKGVDINIGQYVVFDDDNSFLAQTDTVDEAFFIADTNHVKCPALVNLDEFRNLDYVFENSEHSKCEVFFPYVS